jgi:hypothetical protein
MWSDYVVYVRWSSCSFYPRRKAVFRLSRPRSTDRTKQPPRSPDLTPADFYPVWPSKGHSVLERRRHAGRALVFDSCGCDNNATYAWNFSAFQEFLASQDSVVNSNGQHFSATF